MAAGSKSNIPHARGGAGAQQQHAARTFSRNVLALVKFLPIADARQPKYAPDGSTWNSCAPLSS
jgi:hypothetical protein